jgi:hypothetical protein
MGGEIIETLYPSIRKHDRHKNRVCKVRRAGKLDQDGQAQA